MLQVDQFTTTQHAMDVLLVIDDSPSMEDEQAAIADFAQQLAQWLLDNGADFHVGVITTDLEHPDRQGALVERAGRRWVDAATPAPDELLAQLVDVGTQGSDVESGLGAVSLALEAPANDGFRRLDASLHVVVISDADDESFGTETGLADFVDWFGGLGPPRQRSLSVVIDPAAGERYVQVSRQIGGMVATLTGSRWVKVGSSELVWPLSEWTGEYALSRWPVLDTLIVEVVTVLDDGSEERTEWPPAWAYDEERNAVWFVAFAPEVGDTVVLTYEPR